MYSKVKSTEGLLVSLKKTEGCCSILIDPQVKIVTINSLTMTEESKNFIYKSESGLTVAFSEEIFSIYPQRNDFHIKLGGIFSKNPKIDLPAEIVQKEVCNT